MAQYFQQQVAEVDAILYKLRCYRDPQRVRADIVELLKNLPSLQPRSGALAQGATSTHILYLAGTVPIFYNGAQYNIPVNIWVVDSYPFAPPVCYVTPTPGMIIKQKHRHVDSAGMCYLPYLSSWNPNTCNLVGLVGTLTKVFGQDPPVRAVPQQQQQSPPVQPAYPQQGYPPQPYPQQPPQPQQPPKQTYEDPSLVAKRNITAKVQEKMHSFNVATTKEMDDLIIQNAELERKAEMLNQEKLRILEDKNRMENDIDSLTRNFDELSKWLAENDTSSSGVDIDALTEPKDALTKQLLYLVAEDATMEDTLYYLEKKMIAGGLDIDSFLKGVRTVSSEQFIKRATIKKIHERQRAMAH